MSTNHLFLILFVFLFHVNLAIANGSKDNPFTPKASLMRYWSSKISTNSPISPFLLSKASPLSSVNSASFAQLASQNALSTHLPSFCSSANLFCFPDFSPNLVEQKKKSDKFVTYSDKNFIDYGTHQAGRSQSFKNYSHNGNYAYNAFQQYSQNSENRNDKFSQYAMNGNVVDQRFASYGSSANGGNGGFKNYGDKSNGHFMEFKSYSDNGKRRKNEFAKYAEGVNVGVKTFDNYGKNGDSTPNDFDRYDMSTNFAYSNFTSYGDSGQHNNDTFKNYGDTFASFKKYGDAGNSGRESFLNYSQNSIRQGQFEFISYAKKSNSENVDFAAYAGAAEANFSSYGEEAVGHKVGFDNYVGVTTDFKGYAKKGTAFAKYNATNPDEPGKFFRESMLKEGTVMPMPDIEDKMPKRSFLPRAIASKIPLSTAQISRLKEIFNANHNPSVEKMIMEALEECERAPSRGETKRCAGTAEDLIDFATSVLGHNVAVRTTENVNGSKKDIMIGKVKGINGGRVTQSVSCHQSLYPCLLYYCHSVPKVRVYEADILDPNSKAKINHGVAICHLDTSAWSSTHGSFMALGSGPGKIEVCHWIFENDMTWTISD